MEALINKNLGGFYSAKIDKETGVVTIDKTSKEGELSKQQQGFYDVISGVSNDTRGTVSINVVYGSKKVVGDSWDLNAIDAKDMAKFGDGKYMSSASMLGHSLAEQSAKQLDKVERYEDAHKTAGYAAELKITGYNRQSLVFDYTHRSIFGGVGGKLTEAYNIPGQSYNHFVTVKFRTSNIKKVTEDDPYYNKKYNR